jgi:hypothetical protein
MSREREVGLSLVVRWPGSRPNLFNNSRDIARDTFLLVFGANIISAACVCVESVAAAAARTLFINSPELAAYF